MRKKQNDASVRMMSMAHQDSGECKEVLIQEEKDMTDEETCTSSFK